MRSFEHGYLLDTPLSHSLVMGMRALGEFRGRQVLYVQQSPEVLETLRRAAVIQSTESSNRIEGVTVGADRLAALMAKKTTPKDRSEQEVAGYRDALATIHARSEKMVLSTDLILGFHRSLYRFSGEAGGRWKGKDNTIVEVRPDGRRSVRFRPVSAVATPTTSRALV